MPEMSLSTPLNILMLSRGVLPITNPLTGGAENYVFNLSCELASRGHHVELISNCDDEIKAILVKSGVQVHSVPTISLTGQKIVKLGFISWILAHGIGNLVTAIKARNLLSKKRFDVVHGHGSLAMMLLRRWTRSTATVFTLHDAGPWLGSYPRKFERIIRKAVFKMLDVTAAKKATYATVVFKDLYQHLTKDWKLDSGGVVTIPPAVNTNVFQPQKESGSSTKPKEGALFVGHLVSRKGADLLPAISQLAPELHITVAGDGPLYQAIVDDAIKLGVSNSFTFLGAISGPSVSHYMQSAKVLLVPSWSEGLPITVLEALSSGTPVVATNVGGMKDIVTNGKNGFLVEAGDVQAMANNANKIALSDTILYETMSSTARNSVLTSFTWEVITGQFEQIYESAKGTYLSKIP